MILIQSFNLDRLELCKITHIINEMKDLSFLVSLFQQCLGPVGFVAIGNNNYLPEVHPSSTNVRVRKGDGRVHGGSRLRKCQPEETIILIVQERNTGEKAKTLTPNRQ